MQDMENAMHDLVVATEMPRYQCHKQIWALKIAQIDPVSGKGWMITPEEEGYAPFFVSDAYRTKHNPQVGGFFVVYEDGYQSYSPAEALEKGYFKVDWKDSSFMAVEQGTHGPKRVFFTLQDGPIKEVGVNGYQIDTVIEWAKGVIEGFNKRFPCRENSMIITKLDEALMWSTKRKLDRCARQVEGKDKA